MGSPKSWAASSRARRMAALRYARVLYKFLYAMACLAAIYAVLAHFRSAPLISAAELDEEAPPGHETSQHNVSVVLPPISRAEQELRRWIDKPNSLCFGLGNVTILTVAIELPKAYLVQLRRNRLSYASIHGYRYCEVSTTLDSTRPFSWTKIKAMLLVLSFSDIVFAMEADTIIRKKTTRIESILELEEYNVTNKDAIYTNDFHHNHEGDATGRAKSVYIDTGVYIMRNTPWTKDFLESLYNFYRSSLFQKTFREHDAVELYRMKNIDDFNAHVAVIPYRYMNSPLTSDLDQYENGDFVVHYAEENSLEKYRELSLQLAAMDQ